MLLIQLELVFHLCPTCVGIQRNGTGGFPLYKLVTYGFEQVGDITTFPMCCMMQKTASQVMQDTNTFFYVVPIFLMAL